MNADLYIDLIMQLALIYLEKCSFCRRMNLMKRRYAGREYKIKGPVCNLI